ncbi:helix-turn-helix domain-containing protein [Albibacillus kandeliae]|uniref:helix-turn-helix domain-containing protein n=1 Tax=Albibacillus kandeliae TaxID=2174228 RepID=UPI000D697D84
MQPKRRLDCALCERRSPILPDGVSCMRPFTPETLADRWGVSATTIRNQCAAGEIPHFRLGRLYRIPANAVEEIEKCQISPSVGSGEASASPGTTGASGGAISLRHAPERKRRQRL